MGQGGEAEEVAANPCLVPAVDGFLRREAFGEVPPRVECTLTSLGESFAPILHAMLEWSRENLTREDGHGDP